MSNWKSWKFEHGVLENNLSVLFAIVSFSVDLELLFLVEEMMTYPQYWFNKGASQNLIWTQTTKLHQSTRKALKKHQLILENKSEFGLWTKERSTTRLVVTKNQTRLMRLLVLGGRALFITSKIDCFRYTVVANWDFNGSIYQMETPIQKIGHNWF